MYISENTINQAIELIINTMDFCGTKDDKMRVIQDFCADENIKDWHKVYKIANFRANKKWNDYKRQAGVHEKYCF
jgi:hypothetical protein